MSTVVGIPALLNAWTVFWFQLPGLMRVVSVIIVTVTAIRLARTEDIPKVLAIVVTAWSRRSAVPPRRRNKPGKVAERLDVSEGQGK